MSDFMKKPCAHCPYRRDVRPFLTMERAEELAYHIENPYNTFHCHKTLESDDEDTWAGEKSKECAGFLTMRMNANGDDGPDGFEPSYELCYIDSWDMIGAYEAQEAGEWEPS